MNKTVLKALGMIIALVLLVSSTGFASAAASATVDIQILNVSDWHGQLEPLTGGIGGAATLALFDVSGRRVKILREGVLDDGPAEAHWDATDESGRTVAPGVYFARLLAGGHTATARVVVDGR